MMMMMIEKKVQWVSARLGRLNQDDPLGKRCILQETKRFPAHWVCEPTWYSCKAHYHSEEGLTPDQPAGPWLDDKAWMPISKDWTRSCYNNKISKPAEDSHISRSWNEIVAHVALLKIELGFSSCLSRPLIEQIYHYPDRFLRQIRAQYSETKVQLEVLRDGTQVIESVDTLRSWNLDCMKVHLTCIPSLSLDWSITDVLPSQGRNTCALYVYLVLGRLMLVGLDVSISSLFISYCKSSIPLPLV